MIKLLRINFFKDGRNVPLSLAIAIIFLVWSVGYGFLSSLPPFFQLIWSLLYLYAMFNYRYTMNALVHRLVIVVVLMFLKIALSGEFFPVSVTLLIREAVPLQVFRLPLQVLSLALDWVHHMLMLYLVQRDYWSLFLLVIPGFASEYSYWHARELVVAGVLDKAAITAKESGVILKNQMRSKIILKDFYWPIDTSCWLANVRLPGFVRNTFGFVHNPLLQSKFCLDFNDFVSIRNLVGRCRTDMLPHFLADFSANYSEIYAGLGKDMAEQLVPFLVQQSAYMISTNTLAVPGTQLFSELLTTDALLAENKNFGTKSVNSFTALATQIVIGSKYFGSNPKILSFPATKLDLAVLVETEPGCCKLIGVEIKTPRSLDQLAGTLDLKASAANSSKSFFGKVRSYNFDELILIVHTDGRFSPSERADFEGLFYKRYKEDMKVIDFKLVFM
jgi:hypothetical protein